MSVDKSVPTDYEAHGLKKPGINPDYVDPAQRLFQSIDEGLIPSYEFPTELGLLEDEDGNSIPSVWVVLLHESPIPGDISITAGYLAAEPDPLEYAILCPTRVRGRVEWTIMYIPRERVYSCTQLADVDDEAKELKHEG